MTPARTRIGKITPKDPEELLDNETLEPLAHTFNDEGAVGYAGDPLSNRQKTKKDAHPLFMAAVERGLIALIAHINLNCMGTELPEKRDLNEDRRVYELTERGRACLKRIRP